MTQYESQRRAQAKYQAKNRDKYTQCVLKYYETHPEAKEANRIRSRDRTRYLTAVKQLMRIDPSIFA